MLGTYLFYSCAAAGLHVYLSLLGHKPDAYSASLPLVQAPTRGWPVTLELSPGFKP